jgi:hypothetical protein
MQRPERYPKVHRDRAQFQIECQMRGRARLPQRQDPQGCSTLFIEVHGE